MTASIDGHVKLWKKQDQGIEFVKHYRAHLSTIVGISASSDGQLFASVAEDGSAKVFNILDYGIHHSHHYALATHRMCSSTDMINMIKLGFTPLACCWVHKPGTAREVLAVYVPPLVCNR